jgi:AcrR family transcriptional regulator
MTSPKPTPPRPARRHPSQERARVTVEAILQAATQVFRECGIDKATTNRIAALAGVSVGTLYQYFPDKAAIARDLIEREQAVLQERLVASIADVADLRGRVCRLVATVVKAHAEDPELVRAAFATGLVDDHLGIPEGIALVRLLLEQHKDEIPVEDLDQAAWVMVMATDALLHRNLLHPVMSMAALEEQIVRLVLGYLGVKDEPAARRSKDELRCAGD